MKPPNIGALPAEVQQTTQSPLQATSATTTQPASQTVVPMDVTPTPPTTVAAAATVVPPVTNQSTVSQVISKTPTIATTMVTAQAVQQAPLALTTLPQTPSLHTQTTSPQLSMPQTLATTQSQPQSLSSHIPVTQIPPIQQPTMAKIQQPSIPTTNATIVTQPTTPQQSITLASASTTTGPTALVIIPQHSTTTAAANHIKAVTKVTTPISATVGGVAAAHLTLAATTQSTPIQLQAPVTTHVSNITPIALTPAHQQSATTIANRPPSTLPIVPIARAPVTVKSEPNKYTCCLLDNGIRCDRTAGNASFSARIQKIVGTKKLNFALDPTVRHAYICEHHKAIITVAKKTQTALARESKANAAALNYAANNNQNTLVTQPIGKYNDLTRQQQAQIQHPVNLEMLNNQSRLANNHTVSFNNSVRPGAQLAYTHYQSTNTNQTAPMDMMMSSSYDNTGGDNLASSSSSGIDVDLQQLQVNTLRRYKRHFRVPTKPGLNKMQLAESLKTHFRSLPIIEKEAITYFVYIVKCYRNKLDHNPKAD